MTSRAACLLAGLAAACGGDAPSARTRVLDKIPAGVTSIGVADARALAHPRFRPLVDVLRGELPAGFDCVLDSALAGEQVAAGLAPSGDVTVALVTKAAVKCAALSQIEDGLWIATLGAGGPATISATTEQTRARPFLKDAPIAIVTQLANLRVLATAKPTPLAAWVAFDAPDVASATLFATELGLRVKGAEAIEAVAPVAKAITIERTGSQVVARLGDTNADLAVAVREVLTHARRRGDTARAIPCPASFAPPVLSCKPGEQDHNTLEVYSLASAFDELLAARKEVVIQNGRVEGIRLRDDLALFGLASGDVLVAVDGQRLTTIEQLAPTLQKAKVHTQLLVTRLRRFGTIELVEH